MANELQAQYATGNSLYTVILNSAGQAWTGSTFESINSSHWTSYAVTLTEQSASGIYIGSFPAAITSAGVYNLLLRQQSGSSPALGDVSIGSKQITWSGSAEIPNPGASSTLTFGSFK
jgi:hypothetical protein